MVAKITAPPQCHTAVDYISAVNEADKITTLLMHSDGIICTDNNTMAACLEAATLKGDHDLAKPIKHISLNFHRGDAETMTDEKMRKVAQDYMQRMGIEDTEFIIYRHHDKKHPHFHLLFSRVNRKGQVISDKNERKRSAAICKELNEKYQLHTSKGKEAVNTERLRGSTKVKYEVLDKVIKARDNSANWKQFESQLKADGVSVKFHYNNVTRQLMGLSFTQDKYSFSGKKLDKSLVYRELANKFGDIHELAHDNVKEFYDAKRADLLMYNNITKHDAINRAFPDFDLAHPLQAAMAALPDIHSLLSLFDDVPSEQLPYNPNDCVHSEDGSHSFLPLDLLVAVVLAPYSGPIAQCSGGGGGGNDRGWNDDDDKDKWKFRFNFNRSRPAFGYSRKR